MLSSDKPALSLIFEIFLNDAMPIGFMPEVKECDEEITESEHES